MWCTGFPTRSESTTERHATCPAAIACTDTTGRTAGAAETLDLSGEGVGLIGALSSVGGKNRWNGGIQLSADARINATSTLTIGAGSPLIGNGYALKFGGSVILKPLGGVVDEYR